MGPVQDALEIEDVCACVCVCVAVEKWYQSRIPPRRVCEDVKKDIQQLSVAASRTSDRQIAHGVLLVDEGRFSHGAGIR